MSTPSYPPEICPPEGWRKTPAAPAKVVLTAPPNGPGGGTGGAVDTCWKTPNARAKATGAITIASPGSTHDGVVLAVGDTLLVDAGVNGASHADSGIYIYNGPTVPLTRRTDADTGPKLSGAMIGVSAGTLHADTTWRVITDQFVIGPGWLWQWRKMTPGFTTIKELPGPAFPIKVEPATTLEIPVGAVSSPSTGVARLLDATGYSGGLLTADVQGIGGAKEFVADAKFDENVVIRRFLDVNGLVTINSSGIGTHIPNDPMGLVVKSDQGTPGVYPVPWTYPALSVSVGSRFQPGEYPPHVAFGKMYAMPGVPYTPDMTSPNDVYNIYAKVVACNRIRFTWNSGGNAFTEMVVADDTYNPGKRVLHMFNLYSPSSLGTGLVHDASNGSLNYLRSGTAYRIISGGVGGTELVGGTATTGGATFVGGLYISGSITGGSGGGGITPGIKGDINVVSDNDWQINANTIGPAELISTAVVPGTYNLTTITVDQDGRITAASNWNAAALSVIGRSVNSAGVADNIAAAADFQVLRRSGVTLGFGTVDTGGITDKAVTDAKLRDSFGLSVIGRTEDFDGPPADIIAANDHEVLRRNGETVEFGTVATDGITDDAVTDTKLRDSLGLSVIGRNVDFAGDPADIVAEFDFQVLRRKDALLEFGTVDTDGITDDAVTDIKLRDSSPLSVIGRESDTPGDPADIVASIADTVLRYDGTTVGFGAVNLASADAVDGALPIDHGGTGETTKTEAMNALSPTTTKGDLMVDDGTNVIRFPVDLDGYVLIADSTTAEGVRWGLALEEGDYGDITVTDLGETWTIDDGAVTYAKMQEMSGPSLLLGRGSDLGAGPVEEISLGTGLEMVGETLETVGFTGTLGGT